jgi:hypothetical protein
MKTYFLVEKKVCSKIESLKEKKKKYALYFVPPKRDLKNIQRISVD